MSVLARQPDLLAPFLGWAAALALNGVVPKRDHEIVALRVAWNCRSEFEWGEHAEYARAAGLTDDEIAADRLADRCPRVDRSARLRCCARPTNCARVLGVGRHVERARSSFRPGPARRDRHDRGSVHDVVDARERHRHHPPRRPRPPPVPLIPVSCRETGCPGQPVSDKKRGDGERQNSRRTCSITSVSAGWV